MTYACLWCWRQWTFTTLIWGLPLGGVPTYACPGCRRPVMIVDTPAVYDPLR